MNNLINKLNSTVKAERLNAALQIGEQIKAGKIALPTLSRDVNNHIHTIYSFSPYSPSMAVWKSVEAGLVTTGIMDHDSIEGALEFSEAAKYIGIYSTVGVECRANLSDTVFGTRRINNPDQKGVAYMALHAVPSSGYNAVREFFKPYSIKRGERNKLMTESINILMGLDLDYELDVISLSQNVSGGSVTERHILAATSIALINKYGKGEKLIQFIEEFINVGDKQKDWLMDTNSETYMYDLIGVMKGDLMERVYIPAVGELPKYQDVGKLAHDTGSIWAYAYLGDVGDSVTGDKKAQKFEDGYIDELFCWLKEVGFNAVTYMPSRNSSSQIATLKVLLQKYGLMEISGEDINTPRQQFVCLKQREAQFSNLYDSAFALIGNEVAETVGIASMFSERAIKANQNLTERIDIYSRLGKEFGI